MITDHRAPHPWLAIGSLDRRLLPEKVECPVLDILVIRAQVWRLWPEPEGGELLCQGCGSHVGEQCWQPARGPGQRGELVRKVAQLNSVDPEARVGILQT